MSEYTMNPDNDTIMYGDEIKEGMRILQEKSYVRDHVNFGRVTKLRAWTHTTDSMFGGGQTHHNIKFIVVYDSGKQESIDASPNSTFIVKKDSIPGREQVMENSGIPGLGTWEDKYPYGRAGTADRAR